MKLSYLLRDIDPRVWSRVRRAAAAEHLTIRQWIFAAFRAALEAKQ